MKKFLLFAAGVAVALCADAQAYKFCANGVELTNGQRVDISDIYKREATDLIFDPKLTLSTTQGTAVTLTLRNISNECSPELSGFDDKLDYLEGVGQAKLQICSPTFVGNCNFVDKESSWTKTMTVGQEEDLAIERTYSVGSSVEGVEGLTIISEFEVTVEQGGQSTSVTFAINIVDGASITEIDATSTKATEYFNLQGRKVAAPAKGLYIKRQGNEASKVIL